MVKEMDASQLAWLESTFERYRAGLLRYAVKMTGDLELAREAVQETFLKLCKEEREKVAGHEAQWLFTVCRNGIYDMKKKEKKVMSGSIEQQLLDREARPPADLVDTKRSASVIMEILNLLPSNQQEVLRLKFQNELSYREISKVTGLSVSNVGFQIHSGIAKLKKEFQKIQLKQELAKGGAK